MTNTQPDDTHERVIALRRYFARKRAESIAGYKAAELWVGRRAARSWALHYGRLLRKMEGRS